MKNQILVFLAALILVTECKIPDYINVCKWGEPKIDDCIINSIYALIPVLQKGIPELNIPPVEPFHIRNIELKTGTGGVSIGATLKDILAWNGSKFKILSLKSHIPDNFFDYELLIDQVSLTGNYEIDSKIVSVHLKGNGPFVINVTDFYFNGKLKGNKVITDGVEHLKFDRIKFNITIGGGSVNLENLFNGNAVLGKSLNDVINDNMDVFYQAVKPAVEDALEELFTDSANSIGLAFPYDELFPK